MREVLTTGEIAELCGVNLRTVLRWIERGLLDAYKLPGRGDHRVLIGEVRRFMRDNDIPDRTINDSLPRRVLITDDEPAMASAISRVLGQEGYETAIASNGFEAGAMLYSFRPGVMTLDLRMPGADGIRVLRFLQKAEFSAPLKILVVSADSETRLQEAMALGAHAVLRKPFENADLLKAIEKMYGA